FCGSLMAVIVSVWATSAMAQSKPEYEVYALRYATIAGFPVASLVAGAARDRKLDITMMGWLLRRNRRNILLVSGFYRDQFFRQWRVTDFVKPSDALQRVNLKPDDVTDVIVTHMHWDHADGMDLFPKARIWLQKDELQYYAGEAWQARSTHGGI